MDRQEDTRLTNGGVPKKGLSFFRILTINFKATSTVYDMETFKIYRPPPGKIPPNADVVAVFSAPKRASSLEKLIFKNNTA
jgi:hypothetical protein